MYWSRGAWRVGDENQLQSDQTHCTAFVESDATHPSAMSAEVVWKATASEYDSGKDEDDFEVVAGVSLAKGMVRKPCWNLGWCWVSPPLALFTPSLPSYLPFGAMSLECAATSVRAVGVPSLVRTLNRNKSKPNLDPNPHPHDHPLSTIAHSSPPLTGRSTQSSSIHVSPMAGDALTTFTVRPWFDTVEDLQAQAFASDTPSQRQQLVLDGKRLQDDGRVLALHGVVAECTIQVVSVGGKKGERERGQMGERGRERERERETETETEIDSAGRQTNIYTQRER